MAETQRPQALPAQLERAEFEQFVLPHQSPALLPDLILDPCWPLVEFRSGAVRRDPRCPRHAKNRQKRHT
jgi:hypothetical protein